MKVFVYISLIIIAGAYQNCSNDKTYSTLASSGKANSVDGQQLVIDDVPEVLIDDVNRTLDQERQPIVRNNSSSSNNNSRSDMTIKERSCKDKKDGNGRFVCIVAGSGKSTHVSVSDGELGTNNSTPKTACMSADACEKIIGEYLEVKSIESRGYCKNGSAHVSILTDDEVLKLAAKM